MPNHSKNPQTPQNLQNTQNLQNLQMPQNQSPKDFIKKDFAPKSTKTPCQNLKQEFAQDFSPKTDFLIIYGKQILLFAIAHHADKIEQIYLAKEVDKSTFAKLKSTNKPIIKIDNKKAQALARGGNHQGFLATISPLIPLSLKQIKAFDKILVLCGLNDMGNIGGIFRTAYALGVEGIILADTFGDEKIAFSTKNATKTAQKLSTILRASAGAALSMPFCIVPSALSIINELKEASFAIYGAAQNGEHITKAQNLAKNKWALFLGSEDSGLCAKITKKFDRILSIKMHRDFDSLNVGVAAGILISFLLPKE